MLTQKGEKSFEKLRTGLERFSLILLIGLGLWLQLHHNDQYGFWIDEALTPIRASYNLWDLFRGVIYVQGFPTQDTQPPLYFLIISVTKSLFGESDFAYRFPSAIFGVLSIPLMFQLASRIGRSEALGLLAALWTTLSPLLVWYGQEARMYTLLHLLGILLLLLMWRVLRDADSGLSESAVWQGLMIYLIGALLAALTHITALFLIAGHGLIWAWLLWRRTRFGRWLVIAAIVLSLMAIPLLPVLVPRLFTPAESGFTFVSPRTIFIDAIGGYGMGRTAPEIPWLRSLLWWGYLLLFGLGIWSLIQAKRWYPLALLLVSVGFPAILISSISLIKPMYQGIRHIMLGAAPFLLLITIPIGAYPIPLRRVIAGFAFAVPLIGSITALDALYNNPAVAKDDLRGMVRYVEASAGTRDIVVYNDVILQLVHDHYQTREDVTVTSLPVYPHAVLPSTTADLATFAAQYDRIWFVPSPPADNRDKDQVVGRWLQRNGTLIDEKYFNSLSTELKIEGFDTDGIPLESVAIQAPLDGVTNLNLYSAKPIDFGPERIWMETVWGGDAPPKGAEIVVTMTGPDGWQWIRHQQPLLIRSADASFDNGSQSEWEAGRPNRVVVAVKRPQGLPPGIYDLSISLLTEGGSELGRATLPPVEIPFSGPGSSQTAPTMASQRNQNPAVHFSNGVQLARIEIADETVRPGHFLPAHVVWETDHTLNPGSLTYDMQVFGPDNELVFERFGQPGAEWITEWVAGGQYRDHTEVLFPADAQPGFYEFRWRLTEGQAVLNGRRSWQPLPSEWVSLGTVEVTPWPFVSTLPSIQNRVDAIFAGVGTLIGTNQTLDGDQLRIEVVWQVDDVPSAAYFSFVHVVDPISGEIVAQRDWIPVDGLRPTPGWRSGEIIIDSHQINLSDLPSGTYSLVSGLYVPNSFERPSVTQNGAESAERQATIGEVTR